MKPWISCPMFCGRSRPTRDVDHVGNDLSGIRVLDLSRVLAAPYATMALGELGAEVIKIERPGTGDETRQWGPPFWEGLAAYFLSTNRNKKSCEVDLRTSQGQDLVRTLATQWADIVIENFKPGTLERYHLALSDLRDANPRLITATLRGYPEGDDRPGYDFVMQAGTGLMSLTGPVDQEPFKVGIAVADITAGLFLLSGVLAALVTRYESGLGQHVSVSLFDAQLAWWVNVGSAYLVTGDAPQRWGNAHAQLAPYEIFEAQDGHLALAVGNDRQFVALCDLLGHCEWANDPRYETNPSRVRNRQRLHDLLQGTIEKNTVDYWVTAMGQHDVPSGPVRSVPEALRWREQFKPPMHGLVEGVPQMFLPWQFSRSDTRPKTAPPRLGQHTEEIWALYERLRKDSRRDG